MHSECPFLLPFLLAQRLTRTTSLRYRTVKRLRIPDSNIILMLADAAACNPRNPFSGAVYANKGRRLDLYGENIEVDYRGYEVTVENFIRLLTGKLVVCFTFLGTHTKCHMT